MYNNFDWNSNSCKDELYETKYFKDLITFLDNIVINDRNWEEKVKLSNDEKKKCEKYNKLCKLDIFHEGIKFKQFVLGRLSDTKCFINCPNYEVLNISDWTLNKNDMFIYYIYKQKKQKINMNLPICNIFPIRIYVNNSNIKGHFLSLSNKKEKKLLNKFTTKIIPGSITSRELCLLVNLKFDFYGIQKDNDKFEDFILLTRKPFKIIKKFYIDKKIPIPKFIKIN